jgi:hypothetical protein
VSEAVILAPVGDLDPHPLARRLVDRNPPETMLRAVGMEQQIKDATREVPRRGRAKEETFLADVLGPESAQVRVPEVDVKG